jgi:hypothetical protein
MKFAVYLPALGWLVDSCAGGSFNWDVDEAIWFDTEDEANGALVAAHECTELFETAILNTYKIVRVK